MDGQEDIVARYMYGPFGKLVGQWGAMAAGNEMQFSSMPRDNLSGLSLYPFRAYEPNFQRWINQDPIQEWGGINLYRAMNNSPVNWLDPYGLILPFDGPQYINEGAGGGGVGPFEAANDEALLNEALAIQNQVAAEKAADEQFEKEIAPAADEEAKEDQNIQKQLENAMKQNQPAAPSPAGKVPCPKGGVYALRDPDTQEIMYIGRSKNLKSRQGNWANDPERGHLQFEPLYRTDSYAEQRGLEQAAYDQYNPSLNINNPISPGNANYMNYMNAAQQYLGSQ